MSGFTVNGEKGSGTSFSSMICTPCGSPVEEGAKILYAVEQEGKLVWRSGCWHHPVGDAAVILASLGCMKDWVDAHPEHEEAMVEVLQSWLDKAES